MANACAVFKQADVTRATKGVIAAGVQVGRVEIDRDGKIAITAHDPAMPPKSANDWD